jgi:hypothetical protein
MIRNFVLLLFITNLALGQEIIIDGDSLATPQKPIITGDTIAINSYASRYDPQKALLYSAVLPGLGQAYNKKYWKIPIAYAGFIGIGYGIKWNNDIYQELKRGLYYILETGETTGPLPYELTEAQYRTNITNFRRNRDFMYLLFGAMYVLQIVDAHVDAHLKEFDVNPNLQVRIRPSMTSDPLIGNQTGLSLTIRF